MTFPHTKHLIVTNANRKLEVYISVGFNSITGCIYNHSHFNSEKPSFQSDILLDINSRSPSKLQDNEIRSQSQGSTGRACSLQYSL